MAYKIVETQRAAQDLDHILRYLAVSLANPSAASAFADAIEECYRNLEVMPLLYPLCRAARLCRLGYRKAGIKNYIMIYKVREVDRSVQVLRFFHGKQAYERLI